MFFREHWLPPHSVHKAVVLLRREDGSNGCTVVLRGGGGGCSDEGELSRLKRVIRRVALVAANCVYEKAFLVKEYAAPEIRDGGAMNLDDVSLSPFITLDKVGDSESRSCRGGKRSKQLIKIKKNQSKMTGSFISFPSILINNRSKKELSLKKVDHSKNDLDLDRKKFQMVLMSRESRANLSLLGTPRFRMTSFNRLKTPRNRGNKFHSTMSRPTPDLNMRCKHRRCTLTQTPRRLGICCRRSKPRLQKGLQR